MTCIVGLVNDQDVYFGADSSCSDEDTLVSMKESKIFIKNNQIFGCAGDMRCAILMTCLWTPPRFLMLKNTYIMILAIALDLSLRSTK